MFIKTKNFSIEEHVLIDLCISIDLIISSSSFEVIVFLLGVKLLTFVLYPLLRFEDIVKIGMQQNHLSVKVLLCDRCQIN